MLDMQCIFKNQLKILIPTGLIFVGVLLSEALKGSSTATGLRLIYLNGVDISHARGQQLKKVDIQIAENGDLYITAPHYQVHEEDSYVPLSQYVQGVSSPEHLKPHKAGFAPTATLAPNQMIPKQGEPLSPKADSQSVIPTSGPSLGPTDEDFEAPDTEAKNPSQPAALATPNSKAGGNQGGATPNSSAQGASNAPALSQGNSNSPSANPSSVATQGGEKPQGALTPTGGSEPLSESKGTETPTNTAK